MRSLRFTQVLWGVSAIAVAAGAVMFFTTRSEPASFGWFAYQPLAAATAFPTASIFELYPVASAGVVVLVVGLVGLAFLTGHRMGARSASQRPTRPGPAPDS